MSKVPKLRFKEFSGEWEEKKIVDIGINIIDGDRGANYPNGHDFLPEGYCLFLNAKNVTKNGFSFTENAFITKEKDEILRKGKLKRFDIVLTTRGSLGHIAYYDSRIQFEHMRINSGMVLLRTDSKIIDTNYLFKYLNSYKIQNEIIKISFGSAQPQLTVKEISKFKITYPTKPEQQKIASFLSAIDTKIDQLTRKKELLEQYKKGVMQKIFSQELRFKADDGSEFPEWEEKKLGGIANITIGEFVIKTKQNPNAQYPVYNGGKSNTGFYDEYNNEGNKVIISARGANAGFVNFETRRYWAGNSCYSVGIIDKNLYSINFCYYFIKHFESRFTDFQQAANIPSVSKKEVSDFQISLPKIEEQIKIVNFLTAIDTKINIVAKQLDEAKNFKKGLLQQMFV